MRNMVRISGNGFDFLGTWSETIVINTEIDKRIVTEYATRSPELFGSKNTSGDMKANIVIGTIRLTRKNVGFLAKFRRIVTAAPAASTVSLKTSQEPSGSKYIEIVSFKPARTTFTCSLLHDNSILQVWLSNGKSDVSRSHDVSAVIICR